MPSSFQRENHRKEEKGVLPALEQKLQRFTIPLKRGSRHEMLAHQPLNPDDSEISKRPIPQVFRSPHCNLVLRTELTFVDNVHLQARQYVWIMTGYSHFVPMCSTSWNEPCSQLGQSLSIPSEHRFALFRQNCLSPGTQLVSTESCQLHVCYKLGLTGT